MKFSLLANMCDQDTWSIRGMLYQPFREISQALCGDYEGTMEHLWISFELMRGDAERRPPYRFRFQKKVGGSVCRLTGAPTAICLNVGHYSVRPDFDALLAKAPDEVVGYVLNLVYSSTAILLEKRKKFGGFDAERFRSDFLKECHRGGYRTVGKA